VPKSGHGNLTCKLFKAKLDEKSKHALLGKHRYSILAIRYKLAGYVEEIVVKINLHL